MLKNFEKNGASGTSSSLNLIKAVVPQYMSQFMLYANGALPGGSAFSADHDCLWNGWVGMRAHQSNCRNVAREKRKSERERAREKGRERGGGREEERENDDVGDDSEHPDHQPTLSNKRPELN